MEKRFPVFLLFVFLSLLLIFLDKRGFLRPIRGIGEQASLPVQKSFYGIRLKLFSSGQKENEFTLEFEEQKHEIASLKAKMASLEEENKAMRRLLGAPLPSSWQFIPAQVLGEEAGVLKIDKGRKDGVSKMPTVVIDGVFVGKVSFASEALSQVETLRAPDFKLVVIVRQENGGGILARGLLSLSGGKVFLTKVLPEALIREGDLVLTAGEGVAPNVPIGKLAKITSEKGGLYQKAEVELSWNGKIGGVVFLVEER